MRNDIRYAFLMAASLFAVSANAAPMAYAVNSDAVTGGDTLYQIDLATGVDSPRGVLYTGIETLTLTDTEGLAFSPEPNKTLWGMDDDSHKLFPFGALNGSSIDYTEAINLPLSLSGGGNDFGMTFTCDGSLYFTSVVSQSLYRRDPSGTTVRVGGAGALGVNISAIAAIGNPTRLYGLGNGLKDGGKDSPNLYSIDTTSGVATMVGALGETDEFKYHEAGLDFDSDGVLWAITDRSQIDNQKSQILKINVQTGAATLVTTTVNETGYESLAIAPPTECSAPEPADELPRIPTLSLTGSIFAILILMLAGIPFLRRRSPKAKI